MIEKIKNFKGFIAVCFIGVGMMGCTEESDNTNTFAAAPVEIIDCDAGPDFCKDTPEYRLALAAKKARLTGDGYPDKLVSLLDLDGRCVAAVERGPDGFSIQSIEKDGSSSKSEWSTDQESAIRRGVEDGTYLEYFKLNSSRAFQCHGDPAYGARDDWNARLDLNTDLAIRCALSSGVVVCK